MQTGMVRIRFDCKYTVMTETAFPMSLRKIFKGFYFLGEKNTSISAGYTEII